MQMANFLKTLTTNLKAYFPNGVSNSQIFKSGLYILFVTMIRWCAPTGSGKTLPAEYAIDHFTKLGKKVIYTTPIKALSNDKLAELTQKFPNLSFGLLTGDNKFNPEAQVLIMTTEIYEHSS